MCETSTKCSTLLLRNGPPGPIFAPRGNNNWYLHPEQTEMHHNPDLLAPFVLAAQAMRTNTTKAIAAQSGGEYEMFSSRKGFDAQMTNLINPDL